MTASEPLPRSRAAVFNAGRDRARLQCGALCRLRAGRGDRRRSAAHQPARATQRELATPTAAFGRSTSSCWGPSAALACARWPVGLRPRVSDYCQSRRCRDGWRSRSASWCSTSSPTVGTGRIINSASVAVPPGAPFRHRVHRLDRDALSPWRARAVAAAEARGRGAPGGAARGSSALRAGLHHRQPGRARRHRTSRSRSSGALARVLITPALHRFHHSRRWRTSTRTSGRSSPCGIVSSGPIGRIPRARKCKPVYLA